MKNKFVEIRSLKFLKITQDLNKIKKVIDKFFQTLVGRKRVQSFSKKILNSMVVRVRQKFQFFKKNIWFIGNNRAFVNFIIGY